MFKEAGKWRTTPVDIASAIEEAVDNGDMDYDGIIIRNIDDTGSYYKGKDSNVATDYIVFNSNQFKNADNKTPTSNPDIRYSYRGVNKDGIEDRYRSEGAIVDIGVGDGGHGRGKQVRYVGRVQHKAKNNVNFCTAHDYEGIDFFVSGHTHKPMDKAIAKLVYDTKNKTITHKNVENVVCGSFLNFASYAEREGHGPTSTKQYYLFMSGKKKEVVAQGFYV